MVEKSNAPAKARIRALIDERVAAVRVKNINGAMSNITPDIRLFDEVNPLQSTGSEASRNRVETRFSSFQGLIGFEMRDLSISAGGDVAFSQSLNRYSGTLKGGGEIDMWVRATTCYRKIDGRCMITHDHFGQPTVPCTLTDGR